MKNGFLLLSTLVICHYSFSQTAPSGHTFGEGIITIKQYSFPPGDTRSYTPASLANEKNGFSMVYFIKDRKIVRRDERNDMDSAQTGDTIRKGERDLVVRLRAEVALQHYLLDWDTKTAYIFYTKNNMPQISETSLKDQPANDMFYRYTESDIAAMKSPDRKNSVLIAGKKCFKGLAIAANGDSILFYYTETPLKVRAPLNGFFSSSFPYDVLSMKAPVNWTMEDGKPGVGALIIQVAQIQEGALDDALFELPANVPIRENVPWQEMYAH